MRNPGDQDDDDDDDDDNSDPLKQRVKQTYADLEREKSLKHIIRIRDRVLERQHSRIAALFFAA